MDRSRRYSKHFSKRLGHVVRPEGDTPAFKVSVVYVIGFMFGAAWGVINSLRPEWLLWPCVVLHPLGFIAGMFVYVSIRDIEEKLDEHAS